MDFKNEEERFDYYENENNCLEIAKKEIIKQFPKGEALKSYVIEHAPMFDEERTADNVHMFLIVYVRLENDVLLALYEIMANDELIFIPYDRSLDSYEEYIKNMDEYEAEADDDGDEDDYFYDNYDYYYDDAVSGLFYARPEIHKDEDEDEN